MLFTCARCDLEIKEPVSEFNEFKPRLKSGSVTFRIVHFHIVTFHIVTFHIVHFRIVTFRLGNISYR